MKKNILTKPMLTADKIGGLYNSKINELQDEILKEIIDKEVKKREQFLKDRIEEHCKKWQKIYIKWAIKFGWNIWFIKNLIKNVPHELNSDFMGLNFGTQQQYGCEINGKAYWL